MITAKMDMKKLERSLKSAARNFGDSSKQAVLRWGVSAARDLAIQTQVFGQTKTSKKGSAATGSAGSSTINTSFAKGLQENAIVGDALKVVRIAPPNSRERDLLTSSEAVNSWIDQHRTRRRKRTITLHIRDRKPVTEVVFRKAMRERFKRVAMAKGGWLGAGEKIATFQRGSQQIKIGSGYMSFAQRHKKRGSARPAISGFSPVSVLINGWQHSGEPEILSSTAAKNSIYWGLRKTISWYRRAAKTALDKA